MSLPHFPSQLGPEKRVQGDVQQSLTPVLETHCPWKPKLELEEVMGMIAQMKRLNIKLGLCVGLGFAFTHMSKLKQFAAIFSGFAGTLAAAAAKRVLSLKKEKIKWHTERSVRRNGGKGSLTKALQKSRAVFMPFIN